MIKLHHEFMDEFNTQTNSFGLVVQSYEDNSGLRTIEAHLGGVIPTTEHKENTTKFVFMNDAVYLSDGRVMIQVHPHKEKNLMDSIARAQAAADCVKVIYKAMNIPKFSEVYQR